MAIPAWRRLAVVALSAAVLASCGGQEPTGGEVPVGEQPAVVPATSAAEGDEIVGRISSGEVSLGPTMTVPARPTTVGQRRSTSMDEAVANVPFQVLEPQDVPEDTYRDAVFLEEPPEGETVPGLPAVRLIYSFEPEGAIVVLQHLATGEEATGETIDIAGHGGWIVADEPEVFAVEWEQDGLRIQVRGRPEYRDLILAAARSMGPEPLE